MAGKLLSPHTPTYTGTGERKSLSPFSSQLEPAFNIIYTHQFTVPLRPCSSSLTSDLPTLLPVLQENSPATLVPPVVVPTAAQKQLHTLHITAERDRGRGSSCRIMTNCVLKSAVPERELHRHQQTTNT